MHDLAVARGNAGADGGGRLGHHHLVALARGRARHRQTDHAGYFSLANLAPLFEHAIAGGQAVILLDGLDEVQSDRPRLVQAGLEQARRFSWAETARLTVEVYRRVLA